MVAYVPKLDNFSLNDKDIQVFITRDSGPGGQHRNKTDSCVVMRHLPTGIEAKAAAKSQHQNRRTARLVLEQRVAAHYKRAESQRFEKERKDKQGSGMRGDKIRTYREQDDLVTDHRTERKMRLKKLRSGDFTELWK